VLPSGQKVAAAATGLTIAKLRSTKELMDESEVSEDEEKFIACSAKQITDLLESTEVTSSDFNSVKALVQGEVDTFMGFKFIRSERLNTDGNGDRQCIAWAKSGLELGVGADVVTEIAPRPDKSFSMYVYLSMAVGATRLEEEKIVEIAAVE